MQCAVILRFKVKSSPQTLSITKYLTTKVFSIQNEIFQTNVSQRTKFLILILPNHCTSMFAKCIQNVY